jgi:hypothetical protein
MATDAAVRLVNPAGSDVIVLVGGPKRLKGKVRLVNDSAEAITVSAAALRADVPAVVTTKNAQQPVLERWVPCVVPPGEASPVTVTASLDAFTPPGTYEATLVLDGQPRAVELRVVEDISLTLSPSEVVVFGDPDVAQNKNVVITNTGNVALAVSHVGPVPLVPDERRASLLERLGVLERPAEIGPTLAVVEEEEDDEEDDEQPVVEALIDPPVLVHPGEARPVTCAVTVRGDIDPGLRYRADGALYTSDLRFVVVPAQRTPPEAPKASGPRPAGKRPAAKQQSSAAKPRKAQAAKTTKSPATQRAKSTARTTQHRRES